MPEMQNEVQNKANNGEYPKCRKKYIMHDTLNLIKKRSICNFLATKPPESLWKDVPSLRAPLYKCFNK